MFDLESGVQYSQMASTLTEGNILLLDFLFVFM